MEGIYATLFKINCRMPKSGLANAQILDEGQARETFLVTECRADTANGSHVSQSSSLPLLIDKF